METARRSGVDCIIMNHTDFLMVAYFNHVAATHPTTGSVDFKFHTRSTLATQVYTEPNESELHLTKGGKK